MKVEIWSDVVCPWCYIGKRRFERALADFPHRDAVEVTWRSFELDPSAPQVMDGDLDTYLARKYRMSLDRARQAIDHMTAMAENEGLSFKLRESRAGNTLDAHRLIHLAYQHGLGDAMKERLMKAYFCEMARPSDHETLTTLAVEVGLDADIVAEVLASDTHKEAVRNDEEQAYMMGVRGVPFFLIEGKYSVAGAQSPEVLRAALDQVWEKPHPVNTSPAPVCDETGCEV